MQAHHRAGRDELSARVYWRVSGGVFVFSFEENVYREMPRYKSDIIDGFKQGKL